MMDKDPAGLSVSAEHRHDVIEKTVEEVFECGASLRFQKKREGIEVEAEILRKDRRARSIGHNGLLSLLGKGFSRWRHLASHGWLPQEA